MARKKKNKDYEFTPSVERAPDVTFRPINAAYPYPVAPASQIIQLPPIVQPIVMVPFSTQQQPLATFVEDDYYDEDDDF